MARSTGIGGTFFTAALRTPLLLFLALVALACAPVWSVAYYITQDGPAHAYSASLMLRLLSGDASVAQLFAFNPWTVSNSLGHWLLAALLTFVSPFTATKIMATLTYAGVVGAVAYLRLATVGREGLVTSLLIGAAIGFNWLWLGGLYNFLLGAIGFAVTLALFFRWQSRLNPTRIVGLAALLLLVYLSHIVTFGVLVGALILVALSSEAPERQRACVGVGIALVPVTLLALLYGAGADGPALGDERLFPVWRRLSNPWSLVSWVSHIRTADPFFIISRRALPFSTATSGAFAVFTPVLWLLLALAALAWSTVSGRTDNAGRQGARRRLALMTLFGGCALAAALGPDDFGTSHGTLLRERFAFLAVVLFVPLYRTDGNTKATRTFAHLCLAGLLLFQTTALWDYARQGSRDATEFLVLGEALEGRESVASVIVLENGLRFHSNPIAEFSNFLGVGRRTVVWDNYQIGYNLFPVVARDPADRRFVFDLTSANVLDEADPLPVWDAKIAKLATFFEANHARIANILVWRRNAQVETVLGRWYEAEPFFEHGRGRLYKSRVESSEAGSNRLRQGFGGRPALVRTASEPGR